jgi:hypothetical protein
METDKVLYYTDGHEVSVTDSGFKVKNTLYQLSGITRHGFSIISPHRAPYMALLIFGTIVFLCGAMNILPSEWMRSVNIFGFSLLVNSVVMTAGIIFFLSGMAIMFRQKEKYAVRIFTAEGEKNVVVSQSREYISQIVDALNRAYLDLMKKPRQKV